MGRPELSVVVLTAVNVLPSVSPATPRLAVYEVPDVPLQPSKPKPDSFWRTTSGTTLQPNAEVGTRPRTDPNQSKTTTGKLIPVLTQNAVLSTLETNRRITLITPSVSHTNQRNEHNRPAHSFKNASKSPADAKSDPTKNSSSITQTGGIQPSRDGKPGPTVAPVNKTLIIRPHRGLLVPGPVRNVSATCASRPCFPGVQCINRRPPHAGYVCGRCPPGLFGNGRVCTRGAKAGVRFFDVVTNRNVVFVC